MPRHLLRVVLAVIWLLIAAIISVGGAGLVAAMAGQPGTPARPELTYEGDLAAQPGLDRAQAELTDLATDVARLGELGRGALAALVTSDFATLDTSVADGQTLAHAVEDRSAQIREQLLTLPGSGPNEQLVWSPETRQRRDVALVAVQATGGLEEAWIRLGAGAAVANRLSVLLTDHDRIAGEAAATGRKGKYAAALVTLAQAEARITDAKALRDRLANTIDVSTLTQWLDRNAEYDAALANLYNATIAAKGKITDALRQAAIAERRAHDLLPANTTGLVIILAEIGRGGLNEAVIGIEQARAKLQNAVDELAGPAPSETPAPGGGTDVAPSDASSPTDSGSP
jgi:hypothetical protein